MRARSYTTNVFTDNHVKLFRLLQRFVGSLNIVWGGSQSHWIVFSALNSAFGWGVSVVCTVMSQWLLWLHLDWRLVWFPLGVPCASLNRGAAFFGRAHGHILALNLLFDQMTVWRLHIQSFGIRWLHHWARVVDTPHFKNHILVRRVRLRKQFLSTYLSILVSAISWLSIMICSHPVTWWRPVSILLLNPRWILPRRVSIRLALDLDIVGLLNPSCV